VSGFTSHLLAVGGQQVEAAGRDGEADRHAGKLQVTLPQDGCHTARGRLRGTGMRSMSKTQNKVHKKKNDRLLYLFLL